MFNQGFEVHCFNNGQAFNGPTYVADRDHG
jgi:hypothetical protein